MARLIYIRLISVFLAGLSTVSFAARSVEFFASNNTATIDIQTAYQRLNGYEQRSLQKSMVGILQKNHIEQGMFEDILGAYQMADSGHITADNTDAFIASPYQDISDKKAFLIAKQIANAMKQESVAVFIPSIKSAVGEVKLSFTSRQPSIKEVTMLIHDKLPAPYSQAYSLHLDAVCGGFDASKVNAIEWLGNKISLNEIKAAFPNEKITYQLGKAYLVYKNGQQDQL